MHQKLNGTESQRTPKYPLKTNMTVENPPFEDVLPIENGDFPMFWGVDFVESRHSNG